MKLLLTSSGICNNRLRQALVELLGKQIADCKALFIPTAMLPFPDSAYWVYKAIAGTVGPPLAQLGWKSLGVLELTALPNNDKHIWIPTVAEADALLVWGGDPVFLAYWLQESGLAKLLDSINKDLVYVGVSAGSMATSAIFAETYREEPNKNNNFLTSESILFDTPEGEINRTLVTANGAGFIDFAIIPHFENPQHPDACGANAEKWASKLSVPVYAIDDQTAIKVVKDTIEVISEGRWKLFSPGAPPGPADQNGLKEQAH